MDIHFPMMVASTCVVLYLLNLSLPLTIVIILSIIKICCKLTIGKCNSDQDMTGKTVLITGATSGVGKATALDLARRNARIILACRNVEMAKDVANEITFLTGNTDIVIKMLDLTSFESVRKCADDVLKTEKKLHVLINNAGTTESVVKLTKDGSETCIQVNHLSHFLLTLLLLDLLKKSSPSRIINVSSLMYFVTTLDITDLNATREGRFSLFRGNLYARTKIANLLFTRELARKLSGTGVTVNALHPGIVQTGLFRNVKYSIFGILAKLVTWLVGKTPEEGAQTTIYLAVHPEVENTTGKLFYDCKESLLFGRVNRKLAEDFFKLCERIVGVSCESKEKDSSLLQ